MSNLTRYGQTALDKTFPDADESVFGHMVLELGMSPDEATQNLRPWVRDLDRSAELSKKTAYVAAFIGAGAGLATAATMGIGLTAILPIAAAAYNFFAGQQSAREQGVRESEHLLLKTCPELLKLIYALTQKGMPKEALVECYDDLLGAFTMQFQQRASLGMSDELDHDIVKSFQRIVQEKCEAESLARAIVAETENFTFDTLYQSTAATLPIAHTAKKITTSDPTSDEVKAIGNALVNRLVTAHRKEDLEQIGQRVKTDPQGALKMAIAANGLNAASFLDAFPNKAHLYDWANEAMATVIPTAEKEQTIAEYIETTKPDRDVETAVKEAQSVTIPTKADVLKMPLAQRADYLLKLLAEYGCDLRNLIGRPTLAAGGLQRSGKTTLIMLLGILEKAKGQKLFYISRDSDLYPVAFDGYANDSIENAIEALSNLSKTINAGSMGSLTGETWVLDEFSSTAKKLDEETRGEFWGMALTGFAKQGGRVRFIVHHKTAKANGIPAGEAETFKAEVKMFWTDRTEMSDGTYQPSGQYELLQEVGGFYKESGQTFQIPEWLLTDTNPAWHNAPCPVRSLLTFFPEFDTRKGAIAHPLNKLKPKDPFEAEEYGEGEEEYVLPDDPADRLKMAVKLVQKFGTVSSGEVEEIVPGLAKYLPTLTLYYSEVSRDKEVYKWG